uniref:BPTI/Kunitz inhibitor domain-containing protein n=1 Tax=Meloidogyne incognita TaxID=6306 RepID=A0A914L2H6_MELIC
MNKLFGVLFLFLIFLIVDADDYGIPEICKLEQDSGTCLALFERWWYNNDLGQCQNFTYGGCYGNENNFRTKLECQQNCKICELKMVVGPCKAAIPRWWYDNGECKKFIYGGCKGNDNNFKTLEECQKTCNVCELEQDSGPCEALFIRWWYDKGECKKFVYGGCRGNGNNFKTLEECQARCQYT